MSRTWPGLWVTRMIVLVPTYRVRTTWQAPLGLSPDRPNSRGGYSLSHLRWREWPPRGRATPPTTASLLQQTDWEGRSTPRPLGQMGLGHNVRVQVQEARWVDQCGLGSVGGCDVSLRCACLSQRQVPPESLLSCTPTKWKPHG